MQTIKVQAKQYQHKWMCLPSLHSDLLKNLPTGQSENNPAPQRSYTSYSSGVQFSTEFLTCLYLKDHDGKISFSISQKPRQELVTLISEFASRQDQKNVITFDHMFFIDSSTMPKGLLYF